MTMAAAAATAAYRCPQLLRRQGGRGRSLSSDGLVARMTVLSPALLLPLLLLLLTTSDVMNLGVLGLSPSDPRYASLVRCRDEARPTWSSGGAQADESMAACIKELLLAVGPRLKSGRGVRALGIERGDPLIIPLIPLDIPQLSISGNATNVLFGGGFDTLLSPDTVHVEADTAGRRARIVFRTPALTGTGDFHISVDFLRILFPGADLGATGPVIRGRIEGAFEDLVSNTFLILGNPSGPADGKGKAEKSPLLAVRNVGMKQTFGGVRLKMVPVFSGAEEAREKEQQQALISLLNGVSRNEQIRNAVMGELEPSVSQLYSKIYFRLLNGGFDNIDLL